MIDEIKINSVKLESLKAPLIMNPIVSYKVGTYLCIDFEIKTCSGYRTQNHYTGTLDYKLPGRPKKPFCRMSYDEIESLAYSVLQKEFGGKNESEIQK